MEDEKIQTELCNDHFERLCTSSVCVTCPSKIENEAAVRALAALHDKSESDKLTAIVVELRSLRRSNGHIFKELEKIDHKVNGNGKDGLDQRMTVLETKIAISSQNKAHYVAVGIALLSAAVTLFVTFRGT